MMEMEDDPLFPAGTNMVIYRGNPKAKLMIIGEAPGRDEDLAGLPFVGRAGQLLDRMLAALETLESRQRGLTPRARREVPQRHLSRW